MQSVIVAFQCVGIRFESYRSVRQHRYFHENCTVRKSIDLFGVQSRFGWFIRVPSAESPEFPWHLTRSSDERYLWNLICINQHLIYWTFALERLPHNPSNSCCAQTHSHSCSLAFFSALFFSSFTGTSDIRTFSLAHTHTHMLVSTCIHSHSVAWPTYAARIPTHTFVNICEQLSGRFDLPCMY